MIRLKINYIPAIFSNSDHDEMYLNIIFCILGFSRKQRNEPLLLDYNIPKYSDNPCSIITNIILHCYGNLILMIIIFVIMNQIK